MVNSCSCLRRRVSSMSLVRICTVTMMLLRFFLCMCSRARRKQRMRRREIPGREDTDVEQACGSTINSESKRSVVDQVKRELIPRPLLTIKKHIFLASAVSKAMSMKKLRPMAGNLIPHQALVDPKTRQVWQDRRFHQLFQRWLLRMWRSRKLCQKDDVDLNRLHTVICHQVMKSKMLVGRVDFCGTVEKETTAPTVAWAEPSESYDLETPSCSYRQEEKSMKYSLGFLELDLTLKTLLDDFSAKGGVGTFSYKECLAYFGDTCPCRFLLPNQIVDLDLTFPPASPLAPFPACTTHDCPCLTPLKVTG